MVNDGGFIYTVSDPLDRHGVKFMPELVASTTYEVFFGYRYSTTRVKSLAVTIRHADGTVTKTINQRSTPNPSDPGDIYLSLGTFGFDATVAGGVQGVTVDSTGSEAGFKIVVDAVKFVPTRCTENGNWPEEAVVVAGTGGNNAAALAAGAGAGAGPAILGPTSGNAVGSGANGKAPLGTIMLGAAAGIVLMVGIIVGVMRVRGPPTRGKSPSQAPASLFKSNNDHLHKAGTPDMDWDDNEFLAGGGCSSSARIIHGGSTGYLSVGSRGVSTGSLSLAGTTSNGGSSGYISLGGDPTPSPDYLDDPENWSVASGATPTPDYHADSVGIPPVADDYDGATPEPDYQM